jgi:excisionase family DNA binding protein
VSSLKDWYRYVDSKARSRGGSAPDEEENPADERPAPSLRAEEGSAVSPGGSPAPSSASGAAAEEDLDVWSGLFPQRRQPEPKPAAASPERPAVSLDQAPADRPSPPQSDDPASSPPFPRPEPLVEIPRFETFVSTFAPEPPSAAPVSPPPPSSDPPPASEGAARAGATGDARPVSGGSGEEVVPGPAGPTDPARTSASGFLTEGAAVPASEGGSPTPEPAPVETDAPSRETAAADPGDAASPSPAAEEEDGVPWRSPFELPGPGRTISSGASSQRPEAVPPRVAAAGPPVGSQGTGNRIASLSEERPARDEPPVTGAEPRPAPGTEAWERERVERLARTFRETLRVIEESVSAPPPERRRPAALETFFPPAAPAAPLVELPAQAETFSPAPAAAVPEPATLEARPSAPAPAALELPESVDAAPAGAGATASHSDPLSAARLEAAPVPTLPRDTRADIAPPRNSLAPPDAAGRAAVLRSIEEASLIRQRLPQHMDMLLRIPTNEVAQNSYKSPFRESREELIRRLLDPQLTLEEAARMLGVCPTTVRRYTNRGMLRCHRTPGNQRRFRMSDVLLFLEQFGDRIDRAAEAKRFEEAA